MVVSTDLCATLRAHDLFSRFAWIRCEDPNRTEQHNELLPDADQMQNF